MSYSPASVLENIITTVHPFISMFDFPRVRNRYVKGRISDTYTPLSLIRCWDFSIQQRPTFDHLYLQLEDLENQGSFLEEQADDHADYVRK